MITLYPIGIQAIRLMKKRTTRSVKKTYSNSIHTCGVEDRKGGWQESEIGYYRRVDAEISPEKFRMTPFPRREDGIDGSSSLNFSNSSKKVSPSNVKRIDSNNNKFQGRFDESFWKESTEDLNTTAFEVYGSGNDSDFDDSMTFPSIDGISSKNESKHSEANTIHSFVQNDKFQHNNIEKQEEHYSERSKADLFRHTKFSKTGNILRYNPASNVKSTSRSTYLQ